MSDQPRTLKTLLKESLALFNRSLVPLLKLTAATYIPLSAFYMLFLTRLTPDQIEQKGDLAAAMQVLVWAFLFFAVMVVVTLLYQITLIKIIDATRKEEPFSVWELYRQSAGLFLSYAWVILLVTVKVFLWSLLFFIPGIIFGIFYSLSSLAFVLEGKKGNQALVYSKSVVKPSIWRFLGNMITVGLITILIYTIFRLILSALFGAMNPENITAMSVTGEILNSLGSVILSIYPTVFMYVLYQELKQKTHPAAGF